MVYRILIYLCGDNMEDTFLIYQFAWNTPWQFHIHLAQLQDLQHRQYRLKIAGNILGLVVQ